MKILQPSETGLHQQHPQRERITRPPLDPNFYEPLALLDLSIIDPALAGRKCLCVAMNIGTCDEFMILGEQNDGTWTVVSVDGQPPKDPRKGSPWAEPFEDGPDAFNDLPVFEQADMVEAEYGSFEYREHIRIQLAPAQWLQGDDSPPGDWIFVACIDAYQLFGSMFIFYNAERRQAYHLIQCT